MYTQETMPDPTAKLFEYYEGKINRECRTARDPTCVRIVPDNFFPASRNKMALAALNTIMLAI
jgi:hypothetical protein